MWQMDKNRLVQKILERIRLNIESLEAIVSAAHEAATHQELRPEGRYDTQAIEAGYLAGAQTKRLLELRSDFSKLQNFKIKSGVTNVALGSIVRIRDHGWHFFVPVAGGHSLDEEGEKVTLVTVHSVLGRALMGLEVGESAECELPDGTQILEIVEIL